MFSLLFLKFCGAALGVSMGLTWKEMCLRIHSIPAVALFKTWCKLERQNLFSHFCLLMGISTHINRSLISKWLSLGIFNIVLCICSRTEMTQGQHKIWVHFYLCYYSEQHLQICLNFIIINGIQIYTWAIGIKGYVAGICSSIFLS